MSQLSSLLAEAEVLYGARDKNWTPLGVEFCDDRPRIWYPGDRGHVAIQLTDSAREDWKRALFQLAHEVIHLLAPLGQKRALNIEEGLATHFSHLISMRHELGYRSNNPEYLKAEADVVDLFSLDPHAIRKVREREISFNKFTSELITETITGVPADLAGRLCLPFDYAASDAAEAALLG